MMSRTVTQADRSELVPGAPPGHCLVISHGPDPAVIGQRLTLARETKTVIGRAAPTFGARALLDSKISSRHVEFEPAGEHLRFRDLGSKNGTFVRGERGSNGQLSSGDFLQLGNTFLCYRFEPAFRDAEQESLLGGISYAMHQLREAVGQSASHRQPILITGPTGAGKERIALEAHRASGLSGPFVAINCATLNEKLAEAELFGYRRGAFTGADADTPGLFQRADGGTLFLDEIATLPGPVQPKLLRALQEATVRPVGATREEPCAPRICCATNENLMERVADGEFRDDLLARLLGCRLQAPGLAERPEDIGWLCHALLTRSGHSDVSLAASLMWAFLGLPWPHNVRGLEQGLLSHASRAHKGRLHLDEGFRQFCAEQLTLSAVTGVERLSLSSTESPEPQPPPARRKRVKRPDRDAFVGLLRENGGRVERMATHYGVRRQQIYRWVEAHGLSLDEFRDR